MAGVDENAQISARPTAELVSMLSKVTCDGGQGCRHAATRTIGRDPCRPVIQADGLARSNEAPQALAIRNVGIKKIKQETVPLFSDSRRDLTMGSAEEDQKIDAFIGVTNSNRMAGTIR